MPFAFQSLEVADLKLVRPVAHADERGSFAEIYKQSEFAHHGITDEFVQDNVSYSGAGVVRGLHYQLEPAAQAKLVSVLEGSIYDVAVDLRRDAPSFGAWVGIELSAAAGASLYVPAGFAHGFCTLGAAATVHYKMSAEYAPELERGIRWDDPDLAIDWPVASPCVSPRDAGLPAFQVAEHAFGVVAG